VKNNKYTRFKNQNRKYKKSMYGNEIDIQRTTQDIPSKPLNKLVGDRYFPFSCKPPKTYECFERVDLNGDGKIDEKDLFLSINGGNLLLSKYIEFIINNECPVPMECNNG
tara:strand:+ start:2713 stop:3042 length:330 start_codon:yes stop_codon:yes gene_type:complete